MGTNGMTADLPVSADSGLARLVDELAARMRAGGAVDVEAAIAEFPQHAERLRELLPALAILADVSRSAGESAGGLGAPPADGDVPPPGVLGDYLILNEVGRGGMGVVYEAEQISLGRRVALKVLPFAATMDPRQLQRFRHESRAAAILHHPNIVPVYAVGCERGVHYYAMQLIEGQSFAAVIDELRRGLPSGSNGSLVPPDPSGTAGAAGHRAPTVPVAAEVTRKTGPDKAHFRRVAELLVQAADALEFAHSMGVVHRDVKPANLMLDESGHLWVSDFGLAKFDTAANLTISGDLLGTLRYMSPEQALAKHGLVDHRTDVYSLGATLYELLTLRPAVEGTDRQEVLRRIAFEEPAAPRRLDRAIPAELETITLKALAKDPAERYASAGELADDLRRWLSDRVILAKPPTLRQRVVKWGRRHRYVTASAVVALAVAIVALAVSNWLIGRERDVARHQKGLADDRLRQSWDVVDQMYVQVAAAWLDDEPRMEPQQRRFLELAARHYEDFASQQDADPASLARRAGAYASLGKVYNKLGQVDRSCESYRRAVELAEQLASLEPGNPTHRLTVAAYCRTYGNLFVFRLKRPADAETYLRRAVDLCAAAVAEESAVVSHRSALAIALGDLGIALAVENRPEAEGILRKAVDIGEDLVETRGRAEHLAPLAAALDSLANLRAMRRDYDAAQRLYIKAITHETTHLKTGPRSRLGRNHLAHHYRNLATVCHHLNRGADEEAARREEVGLRARLAAEFPLVGEYQLTFIDAKILLATTLQKNGRKGAQELIDEVNGTLDSVIERLPTRETRQSFAPMYQLLGRYYQTIGDVKNAEWPYRQALALLKQEGLRWPPEGRPGQAVAEWSHELALVLVELGRAQEAVPLLDEAIQVWRRLADTAGPLGASPTVPLARSMSLLGHVFLSQGKNAEAEPLLVRAANAMLERQQKDSAANPDELTYAVQGLVKLYDAIGRPTEAAEWRRKLAAHRATAGPDKNPPP